MKKPISQNIGSGSLNISFIANEGAAPFSISLPECSFSAFIHASKNAYEFKESFSIPANGWLSQTTSNNDLDRLSSEHEDKRKTPLQSEIEMNDFSRNELNAHLKANKAEVDSVASAMRTEMANFRTSYMESFGKISDSLTRIEAKADATEKRLTQAQWIVSLVISICAVTLSAVIFFSNKSANKPVQQQPSVVVNTAQPSNIPPPLNQK